MSLYHMGDCLAAVDHFSRAIKLRSDSFSSNNASAYHHRGVCYLKLGRAEKALVDYNRVIEIDPTQALNFFNRGHKYVDMNETRRARISFQRARAVSQERTATMSSRVRSQGSCGSCLRQPEIAAQTSISRAKRGPVIRF